MRRVVAGLLAVVLLAAAGCTADSPKTGGADAAPAGPPCLQAPSPSVAPSGAASVAPTVVPSVVPSVAQVGKPLPAMAVQCFVGGRYVDAALLGAAPTILNLWGSYCGPCRTELPAFQRFETAAGGKVRVVGVVVRDSRDAAQSFIDDKRLTFPMLEDRDLQFAIALSQIVGKPVANALPATLFVAPGGRIVYTYQGDALDDGKIRALAAQHLGIEVPA